MELWNPSAITCNRVCGPAGCTVVMEVSNALYLSRNVPEVEHNHRSYR